MLGSVPVMIAITYYDQERRSRETCSRGSLSACHHCRVRGGLGRALGSSSTALNRLGCQGLLGKLETPGGSSARSPSQLSPVPSAHALSSTEAPSTSGPGQPRLGPLLAAHGPVHSRPSCSEDFLPPAWNILLHSPVMGGSVLSMGPGFQECGLAPLPGRGQKTEAPLEGKGGGGGAGRGPSQTG